MIKKYIRDNIKKFLGMVFILLSGGSLLFGAEYWDRSLNGSPFSFTTIRVASFNDFLYVESRSVGQNPPSIFRSSDTIHWERFPPVYEYTNYYLTPRQMGQIQLSANLLFTHKDALYSLGILTVYRTLDGINWEPVFEHQDKSLINTIYYRKLLMGGATDGDSIYIATYDGEILRSSGEGDSPKWETIAQTFPDVSGTVNQFGIFIFQGSLHIHIASYASEQGAYYTYLFRWKSKDTWELIRSTQVPEGQTYWSYQRYLTCQNKLYFHSPYEFLVTSGEPSGYKWEEINFPETRNFITDQPIVIFDRVHLYSTTPPQKVLTDNGEWEDVTDKEIPISPIRSTHFKNTFYAFSNYIHTLKLGVREANYYPLSLTNLYSGQEEGAVMAMSLKVNVWDNIQLTVKNLGTARGGIDITKVKLAKSLKPVSQGIETLSEFIQDPNDDKKWRMPAPVEVQDGDILFITADISQNASDGAMCIFSIDPDDLKFENNSDYQRREPLLAPPVQIHYRPEGVSPHSMSDAIVFPQPSRDIVNFLYNLSSPADVSIKLLDRNGVLVSEIEDPNKPQGSGISTTWDARQAAPGIYYAIINIKPMSGSERIIKKKVFVDR